MKASIKYTLAAAITVALLVSLSSITAAEKGKGKGKGGAKSKIAQVMAKYHQAPKGQDPVCAKANKGTASPEELAGLVTAYTTLTTCKAPQGDEASWKEKTAALLKAAQDLQAGKAGAVDAYKAAVNCKACHSAHRPQ